MLINFNEIETKDIPNFKGGEGHILMTGYDDGCCKIMKLVLEPGSTVGLHTHEGNSEVVFALSATATCIGDGIEEKLTPGMASYCQEGHNHTLINDGTEDFVFFAVVPQHHL